MSDAKHTPGPWRAQSGFLTVFTITDSATNAVAAALSLENTGGSIVPHSEAEANARLIAKSPELLAMLERLRTAIIYGKVATEDLDAADTLIAEARGES